MAARPDARSGIWHWKGRIAALGLVGLIALLWTGQVWRNQGIALTDAEILTVSLARSLEYQVRGSMRTIDALLSEAADSVDPVGGLDAAQRERFRLRLAGLPEIRNLVLVDADGKVVDLSIAQPGQTPSRGIGTIGDRPYFQTLRDGGAGNSLVVGTPVISRFSGQASIPATKAILRNGVFIGAVAAGIEPLIFRDQIASVAIEPEGGAALIHTDGTFLARVPKHEENLGRSVARSPLFVDHLSRRRSGVAHFVSVADGNDKIVAFETVADYPMLVTVGITRRTALERWRRQTSTEALVLAVLAGALFMAAALYDQRAAAGARMAAQLADARNQLERQVEERTAHLAASNAELERFAYIASHDLKEPLRSVSGFLQLLDRRHRDRLDDEAREYIDFAVNAAKRSSAQIDDLLALSRVGRMDGPAEPCDAESLAKAAAESLSASVEELGAEIVVRPMPVVWCRPAQLQSLFQNLIGNALKYHDEARRPRVELRAEDGPDGMVLFSVIDNGIGIAPEYHETVFGIFQRLHPYGRYPGTGIGLALCRKIVERHGGTIRLDSVLGAGTTVFFTLSRAEAPAGAAAPNS